MTEREMCVQLLDRVPDYKIPYVLAYLQGLTADERTDDSFCEALYQKYLADPDKDTQYTLEDVRKELNM